ncbi:hypothetical protein AZI86_00275 [Bdellovibrio bacteriovorus]|uniref:Lipoprotein n=1 Tax=Bdellovibrio bacteriovorus TaxID=959 RepID=A0A150WM35_BDEBC|nr:hypothetical protein [Bdellovibrio bacteriovorus]KYG65551.1 hypothetical protein AZI86_00275 [Bdellovibrio bacteriovorus]
MIRRALIAAIASLSLGCSGVLWGEHSSLDTGRIQIENTKIDLVNASGLLSLSMTLIGTAPAPVVNGLTLGATQTLVSGNFAYVSYNVQGSTRVGALEVIDISNPYFPKSKSLITYTGYNVNAMAINGSRLYLVGAQGDNINPPSYLRVLNLNPLTGLPTTEAALVYLPSYVANAVLVTSNFIFVSTGDNGGLSIVNNTNYTVLGQSNIYDSRALSMPTFTNALLVLGAQNGRVLAYNPAALSTSATGQTPAPTVSKALGGATIPESKGTLQSGVYFTVAAIGDGGFSIMCNTDGRVLQTQTPYPDATVPAGRNVTNAATIDNGLLYAGNGEGGVQVYSLQYANILSNGCDSLTLNRLGKIGFGSGISVNHVFARNNLLYVASGVSGLKIVSVSPPLLSNLVKDLNLTLVDFVTAPVVNILTGGGSTWLSPSTNRTVGGTSYW